MKRVLFLICVVLLVNAAQATNVDHTGMSNPNEHHEPVTSTMSPLRQRDIPVTQPLTHTVIDDFKRS
uniref:Uncharacterized protein n=1 Tax=Anopheles minimus TaxID=112268 RepID=A0A182WN90_9DIPT